MSIDTLLDEIFRREAGYVDHPADRGGPTNMGITMDTLASWRGHPVTAQDVKDMQRPEATEIYMARYVEPWGFIEDAQLRELMIDWSIHSARKSGVGPAAEAFQQFITDSGFAITVDGAVGEKTRSAWAELAKQKPERASKAYNTLAKARLRSLVNLSLDRKARDFMSRTPDTQLHNLRGWVNRALEFL